MFKRVLIANRGEIACRVIRTCRRLGIHSIAVYSEADAGAQHALQADEAWPIGGAAPADSYLKADTILEVARRSGAEAIHPGYGFLSENAAFARACEDAGIVFIGPPAEAIEAMGSKAEAKALMAAHDVPLVPGYHGEDQDSDLLAQRAGEIGFPLMIKAAAGGGGKGMRIVRQAEDFAVELASAQRESMHAFGDQRMILERYIEHPRHIEFQVFADSHGHAIHLNERECSAQRRYQKVLEETPSPFLDAARRAAMGKAAVAATRAVNYRGAGTIEFIVGADGDFHFMEMNTRLQVEHPVTEMTLGLDLVELQLRVAAGESLPEELLGDEPLPQQGHAIEVRLYAEDPDNGFLPASGHLDGLSLPETSAQVRIDSGVVEGDTVTVHYDPMIAKLIVHGTDRADVLERLQQALGQSWIRGMKSNVAFLERLVAHPAVQEGRIDTGYLDRHLDEFVAGDEPLPDACRLAAFCVAALHEEGQNHAAANDPHSPWAERDAWRVHGHGVRVLALEHNGERLEARLTGHGGHYRFVQDEDAVEVQAAHAADGSFHAAIGDHRLRLPLLQDGTAFVLHDAAGHRQAFRQAEAFTWQSEDGGSAGDVIAPMPGRIVAVRAAAGDEVAEGDELLVMEAMKMELSLKAPAAGVIDVVNATEGEFVEADSVLVRFREDEND